MSLPEVYIRLAERYDDVTKFRTLPYILQMMVTEERAGILLELPGTIEEIAQKLDKDRSEVREVLETSFKRGLLIRTKLAGEGYEYALVDSYIDAIMCDKRNNELGEEFLELWRRFSEEDRSRAPTPSEQPISRIIPIQKTVHIGDQILPYERVSEIIEKSEYRVAMQCACRTRSGLCDYPREDICLIFNKAAKMFIDRGAGREISKEEALEILNKAEELGLIHTTGGDRLSDSPTGVEFICNCCTCCCGLLEPYFRSGKKLKVGRSYRARIDQELCIGCGECQDRCHFGAIKADGDRFEIDEAECMGCGLCAYSCPQEAITLFRLEDPYIPPKVDRQLFSPRGKAQ